MTVVDRLNTKKSELEERLSNLYHGGSNRRETLEYKIKKIEELITAYQSTSPPANLSEAEEALNQQVGFEEQKEKVLNSLKIVGYCEQKSVKKKSLILCLIGPPGVGKTTFSQILSQALKKQFFAVALGGVSDNSLLLGVNEGSSGTEIGQLTKALTETKTHDPLILLDEIDKVGSYKTGSAIHGCLSSVLDPTQNQEILDHYLGIKLDFSKVTFIVTVNDQNKIPDYLFSRTPVIIELSGYNIEQKKEIANKFIQEWFDQNISLDRNNFEITSEALETLIHKTKEKGVRQLKSALDSIFDSCLLQWAQELSQGKSESKIKINPSWVNRIIPADFFNVDLEGNPEKDSENKNEKKELEILRKELVALRGEKSNQTELKVIKFNSLLVLRQVRGNFPEKEYQNYEGKINTASSREEIEIIEKEFLLKIKQKNTPPKPFRENEDKKTRDKLADIELQKKLLAERLQLNNDEMEKLKREIRNLQEQGNKDKTPSIIVIIFLIIWGVYGILKLLIILRKPKKKKTSSW